MNPRKFLLALPATILFATPAPAIQINWGSEVDSVFRDSFGVPLDTTFAIQLGYFESVLGVPFVPDASNTEDWSVRWKTFDQAAFDPAAGYFTSSAVLNADGSSSSSFADNGLGVDFSNQEAYIWIYNSETPGTLSQWFLVTTPAWRIPEKADVCCDTRLPVEWSVSDLTNTNTPVYGKQEGVTGAGDYTVTGPYDLQTFSVVPEPSTSLLFVLGGVTAALRRRRGVTDRMIQ